ncbi:hypothetical protein [Psychrobacillus sp. NPDC093200]|uniref:hypothetical protein n=1 Tax=Psychrobacillus sp. NPDC093200 TaxID=3390656 RepID=UPI003D07B07A
MKKCLFILLVLISFTITGCSRDGLSGEKPPEVNINIGNENYETKLGTYCWNDGCVDTVGPVELLKGKVPIKVNPGEKISFLMEYEPKPNEFHLKQVSESNEENEVLIIENSFSAPTQKGVYYYSYGVWWMDDKEENLSHGDAFYAFVLEVK